MKIKVEPKTCAAVQCLEDECPWKRVCANHASAGDFRTEGGYRPVLRLNEGEVYCESIHAKGHGYEYNDEPIIRGLRPWWAEVQGCCDANCVLWSELAEDTHTYEI